MNEIIKMVGKNAHPITSKIRQKNQHKYKLEFKPDVSLYITMSANFHSHFVPGKSFLCFFQMLNFVPGTYAITRKDQLVKSVNDYAEKHESTENT